MTLDCCCCTCRCGTDKLGQWLKASFWVCLCDAGVCALVACLLMHLNMGLPIWGVLLLKSKWGTCAHHHTGHECSCEMLGMQWLFLWAAIVYCHCEHGHIHCLWQSVVLIAALSACHLNTGTGPPLSWWYLCGLVLWCCYAPMGCIMWRAGSGYEVISAL